MAWYDPRTWFPDDEKQECDHPESSFDYDGTYWYKLLKWEEGDFWSKHDATYVKYRNITNVYVCKYCGRLKTIQTSETLGGPENIIRMKEIRDGKAERPSHGSGGFKNVAEPDDIQPLDEYLADKIESREKFNRPNWEGYGSSE